jgi:hypothetical protein
MPGITRKNGQGRNNNTRKKQKGGNGEKDDQKVLAAINSIKQQELGLDIVHYYSEMPKPMKANKYVIIGSMKRISEQLELRQENKELTLKQLEDTRMEQYEKLYKSIPKHLKKDSEIVQLLLYYEPRLVASTAFPKPLRRQEFFWKTAIMQDPTVFYTLDKIMQRKILRKYPEILLATTNKLDINIKGGISIDKLPDLATRGDAMGIMLSAIFGPQIATAFAPGLLEIGTPITTALEPIIAGVASMLTDAGVAMKIPIAEAGEALVAAATELAPLAAIF